MTPTILCDIDGCILEHPGTGLTDMLTGEPKLLPGVLEKFQHWCINNYHIIILTGRKESCREKTVEQLTKLGLFWDQLVMGVGPGPRHLINDKKRSGNLTAFAHNIDRNKGLDGLDV